MGSAAGRRGRPRPSSRPPGRRRRRPQADIAAAEAAYPPGQRRPTSATAGWPRQQIISAQQLDAAQAEWRRRGRPTSRRRRKQAAAAGESGLGVGRRAPWRGRAPRPQRRPAVDNARLQLSYATHHRAESRDRRATRSAEPGRVGAGGPEPAVDRARTRTSGSPPISRRPSSPRSRVGDSVEFTVDAYPGRDVSGARSRA